MNTARTKYLIAALAFLSVDQCLTTICADLQQYRAEEGRAKQIASNPAKIGSNEIQFLETHPYFPDTVAALAAARTTEARAALLRIALNERALVRGAAASALVNSASNKLEAAQLLASRDPQVREIAIAGMIGTTLDAAVWQKIKPCAQSANIRERRLLASVARFDNGEIGPLEKAKVLLSSMAGIDTLPEAHKEIGYGDWHIRFSESELTYEAFTLAMAEMHGLKREDLAEITLTEPGIVCDCLVVARSLRGDLSNKETLRKIVLHNPLTLVRALALRAFEAVGSQEDIPTLHQVQEQDPTLVPNYMPEIARSDEDLSPRACYPLRERARDVIAQLKK